MSVAVEFGIDAIDAPDTAPPVIVTLDPVTAHASVTRNGAVAREAKAAPAQNLTSSHPVTVEARPKEFATSRI